MRKLKVLFAVLASAVVMIVPAKAQSATIADTVISLATAPNKEFAILLDAVLAADPSIVTALSDPSAQLTVFAPTDRAFVALLQGLNLSAEQLLANKSLLNNVLKYHVLSGAVDSATARSVDGSFVPTLLTGDDLYVSQSGGFLYVDGSRVITTDIKVGNGIIHVIDTVLVPDRVNDDNATTTALNRLASAIAANELRYRTIAGNVIFNSQAAQPQFTILLAAIQAADPAVLAALEDANGNLTVFAPTDAAFLRAFEALGVTPEQVLADRASLTQILLYHVVPGRALASTLSTGEVATLQGASLDVRVSGRAITVNGARVITPNVPALNGLIHVIDGVLLPPS